MQVRQLAIKMALLKGLIRAQSIQLDRLATSSRERWTLIPVKIFVRRGCAALARFFQCRTSPKAESDFRRRQNFGFRAASKYLLEAQHAPMPNLQPGTLLACGEGCTGCLSRDAALQRRPYPAARMMRPRRKTERQGQSSCQGRHQCRRYGLT